jgi:ABC-type multidrug transport system fused ATPase/permease subunit
MRIMTFYNPKSLAVASIILSLIASLCFPLFGIIFSEIMFVIILGPENPNYIQERNKWCMAMVYLALGMGLVVFLQKSVFYITGENLTFEVRSLLYKSLMHKQIGWFDRKDKAPGIISNILSEDITALNGLTTETFATIMETSVGLFVGIFISAIYEWRMAIICIVASPFAMLGGVIMSKLKWTGGGGGMAKAAT